MVAAGGLLLVAFRAWERRREEGGGSPLVHFRLLKIPVLRSGLTMFCAQNLILMGIFFTIPLYLQIVQGFDAFETGVRMLPVSVAMLLTAARRVGACRALGAADDRPRGARPAAGRRDRAAGARSTRRSTTPPSRSRWRVLGVGMGLIASQLGNVVQSAISDRDRSEAGGLQYTAQQLGAALGTALIGAVLITGLIGAFTVNVADNPDIPDSVSQEVGIRVEGQVSFVSADQIEAAATEFGLDDATTEAVVAEYSDAQLQALKTALLAAGFIVLASFAGTRHLPTERFGSASETARAGPEPEPEGASS